MKSKNTPKSRAAKVAVQPKPADIIARYEAETLVTIKRSGMPFQTYSLADLRRDGGGELVVNT